LLRPAGVTVLLAQLGRLLLPRRRRPPSLHGFVFVTAVALLRHRHDRGIHHLTATGHVTVRRKMLVEALEYLLNPPSLGKLLAEQPQRGRVRNAVLDAQPQK